MGNKGAVLEDLAAGLRTSETTVEVLNAIITTVVPGLELDGIGMMFFSPDGRPDLAVTNWASPESTRLYMTEVYKRDPFLTYVLRTGKSVAISDLATATEIEVMRPNGIPEAQTADVSLLLMQVLAPLRGVGSIVGSIQFWPRQPADAAMRSAMDEVALLASLRLAELGVTRPVYRADIAKLTARQAEIVRFVIRGDTNQQVADELGITSHTVKKTLNIVFDLFGVATRTELAAFMGRAMPHLGHVQFPAGYVPVFADRA